ncbi:MAG: hypothetical protein R2793_00380 [Flavobacteriaceae bacterium]
MKVFTAYEYLESRFDLKTRDPYRPYFLVQRVLSAGITILHLPLSFLAVLGWNLLYLNIIIGFSRDVVYRKWRYLCCVSSTQKQQMAVIFGGMFLAFLIILNFLPLDISLKSA